MSWPLGLDVLADLVRLWCMNTVEAIFEQEIQDIDTSGGVNLGRVFACLHVFATSFKAAWEGGDEKMTEGRGAEWKVLPNQIWLPYDQWKLFHPPCIRPKDKKWRLKIQLHALAFSSQLINNEQSLQQERFDFNDAKRLKWWHNQQIKVTILAPLRQLLRPFQKDCILKQGRVGRQVMELHPVFQQLCSFGSTRPEMYLIFWPFRQIPRILIQISCVKDGCGKLREVWGKALSKCYNLPLCWRIGWMGGKSKWYLSRGLVGFYTLKSFVKALAKIKSIFLSLDVSWWHQWVIGRVGDWTDPPSGHQGWGMSMSRQMGGFSFNVERRFHLDKTASHDQRIKTYTHPLSSVWIDATCFGRPSK